MRRDRHEHVILYMRTYSYANRLLAPLISQLSLKAVPESLSRDSLNAFQRDWTGKKEGEKAPALARPPDWGRGRTHAVLSGKKAGEAFGIGNILILIAHEAKDPVPFPSSPEY